LLAAYLLVLLLLLIDEGKLTLTDYLILALYCGGAVLAFIGVFRLLGRLQRRMSAAQRHRWVVVFYWAVGITNLYTLGAAIWANLERPTVAWSVLICGAIAFVALVSLLFYVIVQKGIVEPITHAMGRHHQRKLEIARAQGEAMGRAMRGDRS
jgi:hypothetical protein